MRIIKRFLVFCLIGALAFLIDIAFVNIFFVLKIPFPIARTISIILALIFNFFANRIFTFSATDNKITEQVIPYIMVYTIANLVNLFSSIFIVNILGENAININISSFIGMALSIPISFFGSLLWTFNYVRNVENHTL